MASEYMTCQFANCARLVKNTVSPADCRGKPYIGLEHIEEGALRLSGVGSSNDVTSIKSEFQSGDILFGKLRPYFRKVVRPSFNGVCSTDIWVVRATEAIDQEFLFYWMASKQFVDAATRGSKGTKMPRADWDFVGHSELCIPPVEVQRRIADILGKLDDKIELNRRMNRTLEKMAAALFKSWFIDFDPVHLPAGRQAPRPNPAPHPNSGVWVVYALECENDSIYIGHTQDLERRFREHASGNGADWTKRHEPRRIAYWEQQPSQAAAVAREKKLKTGSGREWLKAEIARRDALTTDCISGGLSALPDRQAGAITNLFPDTFQDSALGPIPHGWKVGKLSDIATNPRRTVKPSEIPPDTPYIGLQDMPRHSIALDTWGKAESVSSGKSKFNEGEILFGKLRPYFHKVGMAPIDGVCSTDILVVVPKSPDWHGYVLSLVSSKPFVDYTTACSEGTKMPRTNWKDMGRYALTLPSVEVAKAFQARVAQLHQRIVASIHENIRLAMLRDTLLPRLLSGDVAVNCLGDVSTIPEAEANG